MDSNGPFDLIKEPPQWYDYLPMVVVIPFVFLAYIAYFVGCLLLPMVIMRRYTKYFHD